MGRGPVGHVCITHSPNPAERRPHYAPRTMHMAYLPSKKNIYVNGQCIGRRALDVALTDMYASRTHRIRPNDDRTTTTYYACMHTYPPASVRAPLTADALCVCFRFCILSHIERTIQTPGQSARCENAVHSDRSSPPLETITHISNLHHPTAAGCARIGAPRGAQSNAGAIVPP